MFQCFVMTSNFTLHATFSPMLSKGRFFHAEDNRSFAIQRSQRIEGKQRLKKSGPEELGIHFLFLYLFPSSVPPLVAQLILFHRGSSNSLSLTPAQQLFFPQRENERERRMLFLPQRLSEIQTEPCQKYMQQYDYYRVTFDHF